VIWLKNRIFYRIPITTLVVLAVTLAVIFSPLPLVQTHEVAAVGGYGYGGGGGGGGAAPAGVTYVYEDVSSSGEFTADVSIESGDGNVELDIPEGTIGLSEQGRRLVSIEVQEMEDPPDPPAESEVIGLVYDFGPDGATFDPAITLTFHYDPDELPEGASEGNLTLAVWDDDSGTWLTLETTVDPETNTLTAKISHFTPFTIISSTRPAAFKATYLLVAPLKVSAGEKVEIRTTVANTGDLRGSYEVILRVNGVREATREVTLAGGMSQTVKFAISKDKAGTYSVSVDGLRGTFGVEAPTVVPAPPAPAPAAPAPAPAVVAPAPAPAAPSVVNWPVIGGIIGAVVLLGLLIFLLVRRRSAA